MTGHFVEELIHRFEVEQQKNDRSGIPLRHRNAEF